MTTRRQKLAAKKMVALTIKRGGKEPTMAEVMREAGYAEATTHNPKQKLTATKGWNEVLEKYLPDDKLVKKHDESLEATKWNDFTGEREPDHSIRLRGVELGYKIKGKLGGDEANVFMQVNTIIGAKKDEYGI